MSHFNKFIAFAVAVAVATIGTCPTMAQEGFLSDTNASRAGLTVAWSTQVKISSKAELVDWQLVVDENQSTTYFVIEYGKRKEVIAETDISPFGVAYGIDNARTAAENRKEIVEKELASKGMEDVEVKIRDYTLPKSTLLALGAGGQVICLDADTGATRWTQPVGDYRLPSIGLGASKTHVAVCNGSSVFCLDFETGRILWEGKCKNGIDSSPTCSEENIYVPLINGRLQTFPIDKFGVGSFNLVAEGGSRARPLTTENHVVWTTEKGHMNVAPLKRRTVEFRLRTSAPIVSQASVSGDRLYVGSMNGFVYGVNETTGQLDWDVSTGQGIMKSPVPFGNDVFVVSSANELYKIDGKEGNYAEGWQVPVRGIKTIAGFGVDTIYCINTAGRLVGVDRNTRAIVKSIEGSSIDLVLPNGITDRMFFATRSGFIQCVHEISSLRPRFLETDLAVAKEKEMMMKEKEMMRKDESAMGADNPFGDDSEKKSMDDDNDNPFGTDNDDAGGGDANPFSRPGEDDDDDDDDDNPFGNG